MRNFIAVIYAFILCLTSLPAMGQGYFTKSEIYNQTSGNTADVTDASALKVDIAGGGNSSGILQDNAVADGNGTALDVDGYSTIVFSVTGSLGGGTTVNFEASTDNNTWVPLLAVNTGSTVTAVSTTATGDWTASVSGYSYVRARISGYGSGTVIVTGTAGVGGTTTVANPVSCLQSGAWSVTSNTAQINGVNVTMGNGISGTGVQRVTIASDSTGVLGLATGSNVIGALTANQSVNCAQMNGVAVTMGNGVSGTGVQRVTLASDSTGVVGLATGTNTIGAVKLIDGSGNVASISAGGALSVSGGGGGGTQYAEDTGHVSGDTGTLSLAVRNDSEAALTTTTLDYSAMAVDSAGRVKTQVSKGITSSGTVMQNAAVGTGNGTALDVDGYNTAILDVRPTGLARFIVEGSEDNSTWSPVPVTRIDESESQSSTVNVYNVIRSIYLLRANVSGLKYLRTRITNVSSGALTVTGYSSSLSAPYNGSPETSRTYMVCNPEYTVPATPTDLVEFSNASYYNLKVLRVRLFAYQTTAAMDKFFLVLRSTADTGGTPVSTTGVAVDSADIATSAPIKHYTANPAALGTVAFTFPISMQVPAVASNTTPNWLTVYEAPRRGEGKPITLRSGYGLCLNLAGVALPAGLKVMMEVTYTEE